jgi:hypothetical protein
MTRFDIGASSGEIKRNIPDPGDEAALRQHGIIGPDKHQPKVEVVHLSLAERKFGKEFAGRLLREIRLENERRHQASLRGSHKPQSRLPATTRQRTRAKARRRARTATQSRVAGHARSAADPDGPPGARRKYLARCLHQLGAPALFHFLNDIQSGKPLWGTLEEYAELLPMIGLIRAYHGDRFEPAVFAVEEGEPCSSF